MVAALAFRATWAKPSRSWRTLSAVHHSTSQKMLSSTGPALCYAEAVTGSAGQHRVLHSNILHARQRCRHQVQAEGGKGSQQSVDEDARLEELELGTRRRAPGKTKSKPRKQKVVVDAPSSSSGLAEWKEGQLFPVGWEDMPLSRKAAELWVGKRGALFWATKAAWASLFVIAGAWVLFRIVGPALGLYTLKNDLLSPPNL